MPDAAPLDALRRAQGQVVRAAHALAKALQGEGIDGAGLRDTATGVATGLMEVDAELTAALAVAPRNRDDAWKSPRMHLAPLDLLALAVERSPQDQIGRDTAFDLRSLAQHLAAVGRAREAVSTRDYEYIEETAIEAIALLSEKQSPAPAASPVCDCGLMVETHATGDGSVREHKPTCAIKRGGRFGSPAASLEVEALDALEMLLDEDIKLGDCRKPVLAVLRKAGRHE